MPRPAEMVTLFLDGAHVVARAIADRAVADNWDRESVLEDQLVSGLAGHLARGGVWLVADYLDGGTPSASAPVDFESAAAYYAALLGAATPAAHQAIRERGAAIAMVGHAELVRQVNERLDVIEQKLPSFDPDHPVAVRAGRVMRLSDYLVSRIIEQVVHLDDLARSTDHEPWPMPIDSQDLVIAVGTEIARLTAGRIAVLRALYRRGYAENVFPVL